MLSQLESEKKMTTRGMRIVGGIAVALILSGTTSACMVEVPEEDGSPSVSASEAAQDTGTQKDTEEDAKQAAPKSPGEQFKAFVSKNGTPTEKDAVKHVTKVQGADEQNDILDSAEVHTDYTGGMFGSDASKGKLLASAFADWKDSKNGLVTVYDKDGEMLSNGNF